MNAPHPATKSPAPRAAPRRQGRLLWPAVLCGLAACRGADTIAPGPDPRPDPAPAVAVDDPVPPAEPPQVPWLVDARELTSNAGAYRIAWTSEPAQVPINEPFGLLVEVTGGSREGEGASADASLSVDAWMPDHEHGLVRLPLIERVGTGRFAVEGLLFHMPGRWQLFFDVTRGPLTERAQVEIELD